MCGRRLYSTYRLYEDLLGGTIGPGRLEIRVDQAVYSIPAGCTIAEKNSCPIRRTPPHPELRPPTWAATGPYPQQCGSNLSDCPFVFFLKKY